MREPVDGNLPDFMVMEIQLPGLVWCFRGEGEMLCVYVCVCACVCMCVCACVCVCVHLYSSISGKEGVFWFCVTIQTSH